MYFRNNGAIVSAWVVASSLSLGCASQKSNTDRESAKAAQAQTEEFLAERREFTREARERLDELNDEIIVLAVNIQQHGSDPQQAEWGERLFRLKQERNRLDTELLDASETTREEWSDLHAELSGEIETLENNVNRAVHEVIQDLRATARAAQAAPPASSELDLCQVQVKGTAADVQQQGELLIVQLTAATPEGVEALQQRAEQLSENGSSGSSMSPPSSPPSAGPGSAQAANVPLAVHLQIAEIDNGVVFVFTPAEGQLAALKAQLEKEAEQIESKRC
jgi:hypothetical protein